MKRSPRYPSAAVRVAAALSIALPLAAGPAAATETEPRSLSVIGSVERVALAEGGVTLEAKVDTGADSTSIDARGIERFDRDGGDWVRFEVRTNDGQSVTFERAVIDTVTIVGAGDEEQERLVVELGLCVADVYRDVEVNLADRSGLKYRLLLGRRLLEDGGFLVNVAQSFSHAPRCDAVVVR
ncbi:MAG: ATP-dependent zinc protease [Alphaproteobacteria bacterium]|jgi:hypothetical protein|nr:ATP-dependent zinc protease [Alphaproteobacteria bacterium]